MPPGPLPWGSAGFKTNSHKQQSTATAAANNQIEGNAKAGIGKLNNLLGPAALLDELEELLSAIAPLAASAGIRLQLDPTFQPQFALYDGLVMQLVCQGPHAPVAIANGGRYNKLLKKFSPLDAEATGVGFSFSVGEVRVLLGNASGHAPFQTKTVGSWHFSDLSC